MLVSQSARSTGAPRALTLRAKLTNDPLKMPGVSGHTTEGRRFRDLMLAYSGPLGGLEALGAADTALVREAVSKTLLSEAMAASLARGEAVDAEQAVRIGNTLSKLLRQLEQRAKALAQKQPTLAELMAASPRMTRAEIEAELAKT